MKQETMLTKRLVLQGVWRVVSAALAFLLVTGTMATHTAVAATTEVSAISLDTPPNQTPDGNVPSGWAAQSTLPSAGRVDPLAHIAPGTVTPEGIWIYAFHDPYGSGVTLAVHGVITWYLRTPWTGTANAVDLWFLKQVGTTYAWIKGFRLYRATSSAVYYLDYIPGTWIIGPNERLWMALYAVGGNATFSEPTTVPAK